MALVAVGGVGVVLARLRPAAPTVARSVIWPGVVTRGPMVRQVRGLGTLVPEDIRWIILRPGTSVSRGT